MDMNTAGSDRVEQKAEPETETAAPAKVKRVKIKRRIAKPQRESSTIGFPYRDLDSGVAVALAMIGAGGVPLTTEQLAGVMNLQTGSGNFVMKVATARMFGLVVNTGGKYELTNTGFAIVDKDEKRQRQARAEAFLNVPLYRRVYDEFRGKQLPPRPHGLEQAFVRFGVTPKRKENARWAFEKSANQAGFFAAGPDRLIEPIMGGVSPSGRPPVDDGGNGDGNGDRNRSLIEPTPIPKGGARNHHFIQGLLDSLPEPQTNWTMEGRAKWLMTAAHAFDLMYNGTGEILITAKPAPEAKE